MKFARALIVVLFLISNHLLDYGPFELLTSFAQGSLTSQGGETVVNFTPPIATLRINTPATTFTAPGINTFLLTVQPTVSARVYITNETANPCLATFTISMAVTSLGGVSSFNNSLQSWQSAALINPAGGISTFVPVDIPASSTVYVTSTAISAPSLAIQVVNTNGGCATTNIDVVVVLSTVALTSPLISVGAGGVNGGLTANVQGVIPTGANGQPVLPVIVGALQPAGNTNTAALGLDVTGTGFLSYTNGQSVTFTIGTPPTPTQAGEFALGFASPVSIGVTNTIVGWSCVEGGTSCIGGSVPNPITRSLSSNGSNALQFAVVNSGNNQIASSAFLIFSKAPTIRQHTTANNTVTIATAANTLAGSTIVVSIACTVTTTCTMAPTDTQGLTWRLATSDQLTPAGSSMQSWIAGPSTAAAETVTFNATGGSTIAGSSILELSGITAAPLNQPASPFPADSNKVLVTGGNLPGVTDPCQAAGTLKSHAFANITTATTTALVVPVAGAVVYICEVDFGITGTTTAGTILFEQGTGVACTTGPTALTATYTDAGATITDIFTHIGSGAATAFKTAAGGGVCALTTVGTAPSLPVDLTFVQQ